MQIDQLKLELHIDKLEYQKRDVAEIDLRVDKTIKLKVSKKDVEVEGAQKL